MATLFYEALNHRQIKVGDYFWCVDPNGKEKLYRLTLQKGKPRLRGCEPTDNKIMLKGHEGWDNLSALADNLANRECFNPQFFESVHACRAPLEEYKIPSISNWCYIERTLKDQYLTHPDDIHLEAYALATRYEDNVKYGETHFGIFVVQNAGITQFQLVDANGGRWKEYFRVRPEAIAKDTLRIGMKGFDGTKERPWVCIPENQA